MPDTLVLYIYEQGFWPKSKLGLELVRRIGHMLTPLATPL
jgi:hypothetical protein